MDNQFWETIKQAEQMGKQTRKMGTQIPNIGMQIPNIGMPFQQIPNIGMPFSQNFSVINMNFTKKNHGQAQQNDAVIHIELKIQGNSFQRIITLFYDGMEMKLEGSTQPLDFYILDFPDECELHIYGDILGGETRERIKTSETRPICVKLCNHFEVKFDLIFDFPECKQSAKIIVNKFC